MTKEFVQSATTQTTAIRSEEFTDALKTVEKTHEILSINQNSK